jgi:hypothetical protein
MILSFLRELYRCPLFHALAVAAELPEDGRQTVGKDIYKQPGLLMDASAEAGLILSNLCANQKNTRLLNSFRPYYQDVILVAVGEWTLLCPGHRSQAWEAGQTQLLD